MPCRVRLGLAAAAVGAVVVPVAPSVPAPLPNLVQEPPSRISALLVGGAWRLGFASTVDNLGVAPLVVTASRPNLRTQTMKAFQTAGGKRLARVGTLHFNVDPTHSHWHLLPFETYEVRALPNGALVGTARKTGFCLNDSKRVTAGARSQHRTRCGLEQPKLLQLVQGISTGWADVYDPQREGQYVDITAAPAGRYAVVNRVNPGRAIRETSYTDNVAGAPGGQSRAAAPPRARSAERPVAASACRVRTASTRPCTTSSSSSRRLSSSRFPSASKRVSAWEKTTSPSTMRAPIVASTLRSSA
jgi:hypothetical protein